MATEKVDFAAPTHPLWFWKHNFTTVEGVELKLTSARVRYPNSDAVPVEPQQFAGDSHPLASLDDISRIVVFSFFQITDGADAVFNLEFSRLDNDADYVPIATGITPAASLLNQPDVSPNIDVFENPFPSSFLRSASSTAIDDELWCRIVIPSPGSSATVSRPHVLVLFLPGHTASQAVPHRGFNVSSINYR